MIVPTNEQKQAIRSVSSHTSYLRIIKMLEDELKICDGTLRNAVPERVQQLQGRAQLLSELIKLL